MAGMDSLSQAMPNPMEGAGGGVGGKSPGASPAAKQGMQEAVQQALRERVQQGGGLPPGDKGAGKTPPPGGAGGGKGQQGSSATSGGAFGMSPPGEAKGGGGKTASGEDYDPQEQKQVFMKMMVAQLEHQDPLNPTKGTEFTTQLAQFNNVEQQIRSNDYLEKMTSKDDQQQRWNAMSLLGRNVVLDRDSLQLDSNPGKQQFQFQVDAPAHVAARVTDSEGNLVKEVDLGKREAGSHRATWDGTNNKGEPVPGGEYTIRAVPARGDGNPYQTQVQATVQEVKMGESGVQLGIGRGQSVAFDQVKTVSR